MATAHCVFWIIVVSCILTTAGMQCSVAELKIQLANSVTKRGPPIVIIVGTYSLGQHFCDLQVVWFICAVVYMLCMVYMCCGLYAVCRV